jgi:phosphonate transport system substrate-binding protein
MQLQVDARGAGANSVLANMIGPRSSPQARPSWFADLDGDLIADAPNDAAQVQSPSQLVFSYIAEGEGALSDVDSENRRLLWKELIAALSKRTNLPMEFVHFSKTDEQLGAFQHGEIQVIGLNTGSVETAVEQFGFVPLCTLGRDDGSYGYTMKIIVPASSDVDGIPKLRDRMVTFTRPNSNSGFKAALVLLMDSYGMLPERDYRWSFSLDHDKSIQLVATRETDAAAIASDVLARMIGTGKIEADSIRTIYESERFPPATIGIPHNLTPELADAIRQELLDFNWKETPLEREFEPTGATRFVPVNYKDDWANIRRIEQSLDRARKAR